MNTFLSIFLSLFLITLTGLSTVLATGFLKNSHPLYRLTISYAAGISILTIQMMVFSFISVPWSFFSLFTPWIILMSYCIFKNKSNIFMPKISLKYTDKVSLFLILLIALICIFVIFESSLRPLLAFDAWANWFLTGKAYFTLGFLDPSYIAYADNSNAPLLNLFISLIYLFSGFANEQAALILLSLFFVSTVIVFYFSAVNFMTQRYALFFTLILSLTGNLIRHGGRFDIGYGDLPLGFFIFCSSVFVLMLYKKFTVPTLIFFNLFITTAALIKTEGIPIYLISQIIVLFILASRKDCEKIKYITVTLVSVVILITWYVFKQMHNLPENPFFQPNINFERIPVVIYGTFREYFNFSRWNLLWIAFILSLFALYKNKYSLILGIICILQLSVYFVIYLTTPLTPLAHMASSYDRLLLHLAPTAMLMIAITFNELLRKNK